MRTGLAQTGTCIGDKMLLEAKLTESGQPLRNCAKVVAYLAGPERKEEIRLVESENNKGDFSAEIGTENRGFGLYRFRIVATGRTLRNERFRREYLRTGAIYVAVPPDENESLIEG